MSNGTEEKNETTDNEKLSLFNDWKKYYLRWIIFGFIGGGLQPVYDNLEQFGIVKLWQCISGLPFGVLCAITFTFIQNKFNSKRNKQTTYIFIFCIWMSMKFVIAGFNAIL